MKFLLKWMLEVLGKSVLAAICLMIGLAALFYTIFGIRGYVGERNARSEFVKLLESIDSPEQGKSLNAKNDRCRLFSSYPDGSWMAFCYWDDHMSTPMRSMTLMRDSNGHWYESREHHCGGIRRYESLLHEIDPREKTPENEEILAHLRNELSRDGFYVIANAPDIESARKELLKIGFVEL